MTGYFGNYGNLGNYQFFEDMLRIVSNPRNYYQELLDMSGIVGNGGIYWKLVDNCGNYTHNFWI